MTDRPITIDLLCLVVITALSTLSYIGQLGFYSDDWAILAGFANDDRDWFGHATSGAFRARPVQGLYLAALFEAFGLRPLGYHAVNSAVLALCTALLYLLLVRLGLGRAQAFAAALLFIMLPQLSTVRVWYAAFQIPLSLGLMLVSIHCQLSFARGRGAGWMICAIVTGLLSIAAYEIFAPLLVGFAVGTVLVRWRSAAVGDRNQRLGVAVAVLSMVVLGFVYKLTSSGRAGDVTDPGRYVAGLRQLFRRDYDWRVESGLNIVATPSAHFLAPVRGWWTGAQTILSGSAGAVVTVLAVLLAALAWWRLNSDCQIRHTMKPGRSLSLGATAFVLGNVTFLIVPAVVFTPTGMGNRAHVAAAIGAALTFSGMIAIAAMTAPPRFRGPLFSLATAAIAASALARLDSITRYWAQARAMQQQVLAVAREDLRHIPANSTVILDGVCPYHGPAVLFEASWDVAGALTLALQRPMAGDVVSSRMSATGSGLATSIYKEPSFYPYGDRLYIYNVSSRRLYGMTDTRTAYRYFADHERMSCPGFVARGVEV